MDFINSGEELHSLIADNRLVIVEYGSRSCAPCKAIKEKTDMFIMENPDVKGAYVSIEALPELAAEVSVFSSPTVIVFAEGRESLRESGYFSLEDVFFRIKRYLELMKI